MPRSTPLPQPRSRPSHGFRPSAAVATLTRRIGPHPRVRRRSAARSLAECEAAGQSAATRQILFRAPPHRGRAGSRAKACRRRASRASWSSLFVERCPASGVTSPSSSFRTESARCEPAIRREGRSQTIRRRLKSPTEQRRRRRAFTRLSSRAASARLWELRRDVARDALRSK